MERLSANRRIGFFRRRAGFTLLELLVALSVASIAVSVFISLYTSSLDIARTSRNHTVAANLAEAQLDLIELHPERYFWGIPDELGPEQFPVGIGPEDPPAGNAFEPPAAMPANEAAHRRQTAMYDNFRWKAFGRLPAPEAQYFELTVVVQWEETLHERALAVTGAVPRAAVAGGIE